VSDPIRLLVPLCLVIVGAVGLIVLSFFAAEWKAAEWKVWAVMAAGFLFAAGLWSAYIEIKLYRKF
jgi:hypothetical protein